MSCLLYHTSKKSHNYRGNTITVKLVVFTVGEKAKNPNWPGVN